MKEEKHGYSKHRESKERSIRRNELKNDKYLNTKDARHTFSMHELKKLRRIKYPHFHCTQQIVFPETCFFDELITPRYRVEFGVRPKQRGSKTYIHVDYAIRQTTINFSVVAGS